jgi:cell wall-associated NlpC family hydrolase
VLGAPLHTRVSRSRLIATSLVAVAITAGAGVSTASAATAPAKATVGKPATAVVTTHLSATARRAAFGRSVLAEAARHRGVPYVYGASGPGAFDCSGFTSYVYRKMGISLPHSSYGQFAMVEHIPRGAALPGDLIFLNGLGHVAIYAGHGMMWDAPSPGGRVSERPIYSSAYLVGRVRL